MCYPFKFTLFIILSRNILIYLTGTRWCRMVLGHTTGQGLLTAIPEVDIGTKDSILRNEFQNDILFSIFFPQLDAKVKYSKYVFFGCSCVKVLVCKMYIKHKINVTQLPVKWRCSGKVYFVERLATCYTVCVHITTR